MALPIRTSFKPMEARAVDEPPVGPEWEYEPKWDGFRCIVFRDGDKATLQSRNGRPLGRYFPDLVQATLSLPARRFVLDGEIVVPVGGRLSFDELLLRVHPAESRVRRLAAEHPAMFIAFDLLVDARGRSLVKTPLAERRPELEAFAAANFTATDALRLSPSTRSLAEARRWFKVVGSNLDGIIAKRTDLPYRAGERDGMVKIKHKRTADCVVGGFRYATRRNPPLVGSLLLGLYNERDELDHVGFSSSFTAEQRRAITAIVLPKKGGAGFSGRAPGGPSRWSTERTTQWQPLDPTLVVEVEYDHFSEERFRHGTHFLRWRPDKKPRQCTLEQVAPSGGSTLKLLRGGAVPSRRAASPRV